MTQLALFADPEPAPPPEPRYPDPRPWPPIPPTPWPQPCTAPAAPGTPNGCRVCGIGQREHGQRWYPVQGWHGWIAPDDAMRLARMRARRRAREAVGIAIAQGAVLSLLLLVYVAWLPTTVWS